MTGSRNDRFVKWLCGDILNRAALGIASLVCVLGVGTHAIFMPRETQRVPVERLAENITRRLKVNPDDISLRLNLARLFAMAYALKASDFGAGTGDSATALPFFPVDDPYVPKQIVPTRTSEQRQRAASDLKKAVAAYEDVVKRAPENFIARLGYGWVLEQSGRAADAVAEYRRVVELAEPVERKQSVWVGQEPAAVEAATRLYALLDPVANAAEIRQLKQKMEGFDRIGRKITPIAIPLGEDVTTPPLASAAQVLFDADGSGIPRRWTWTDKNAGWLVYDADGRGEITSALQWFGSVTFWLFWSNGYEALAALDDNGDRELRGNELRHLAIWHDRNQNGISERGEVRPLASHRIIALSTRHEPGDGLTVAAHSARGVVFADGTTRPSFDIILRTNPTRHSSTPPMH